MYRVNESPRTRGAKKVKDGGGEGTYHHLLNHASGLAIQVTQLGVLGRNLGSVNLCVTLNDALPPLGAVELFQIDVELLLFRVVLADQCPGRLVSLDELVELSLCYERCFEVESFSYTAYNSRDRGEERDPYVPTGDASFTIGSLHQ